MTNPTKQSSGPNGGESHQAADDGTDATSVLTTNQGIAISDNQNSLRTGARGPTLLEDFVLREKIFHFDHERIPERIVHARGSGAHGFFEATCDISDLTRAALFKKGARTEVFARFSTVAGGAGSVDTPRDIIQGKAQRFVSTHSASYNAFAIQHHLISRNTMRQFRISTMVKWFAASAAES